MTVKPTAREMSRKLAILLCVCERHGDEPCSICREEVEAYGRAVFDETMRAVEHEFTTRSPDVVREVGMGKDRPRWCPHPTSCAPMVSFQEAICGGRMAKPEDHNTDFNTHRLCFQDDTGGPPFDLQVNHSDLFWLFRVLNTIREDADRAYRAEAARRARESDAP